MSINHCLVSSGLSVPVNIASCNRLKSNMLPSLCSYELLLILAKGALSASANFPSYFEESSEYQRSFL